MSVDPDLSFIRIDVDPEKVEPIDLKKLIVSVNEFLLRSCDILNNFAGKMEESILELEYRLDRVETELILVETRLEKVNDTKNVHSSNATVSSFAQPSEISLNMNSDSNLETSNESGLKTQPPISEHTTELTSSKSVEPVKIEENVILNKDHPSYTMYFKMLRLGIPELGVKQKMLSEGIDPNILNNPNALAPNIPIPIQPTEQFSDSDVHSDSSCSDAD